MSTPLKTTFANRWLFGKLIMMNLVKTPQTNALVRTTLASTMIHGGVEEDVLPSIARALINVRILPGDSIEGAVARVRRVIDDPSVSVRVLEHTAFEPSSVSDVGSESFEVMQRTIHEIFPGVIVAPSLVLARVDARHYESLARNSYQFIPMRLGNDDLARIHGTNERIAVDQYLDIVRFFARLIENSDGG